MKTYQDVLNQINSTDEGRQADRFNIIATAIHLASIHYADNDTIIEALNDSLDLIDAIEIESIFDVVYNEREL